MDWLFDILLNKDLLVNVIGVSIGALCVSGIMYYKQERDEQTKEKETHLKIIKTEAIKMLSNLKSSVNLFYDLYKNSDSDIIGGIEEPIFLEYNLNEILLANEYCKNKGLASKFKLKNILVFDLIDSVTEVERIKSIIEEINKQIGNMSKDKATQDSKVKLRDLLFKAQNLLIREKKGEIISLEERKILEEETRQMHSKVITPDIQALKDILMYMLNNNKPILLQYIKRTGSLFFTLLKIVEFLDDKDTLRKEVEDTEIFKKYKSLIEIKS